jgi:hypothetical protein
MRPEGRVNGDSSDGEARMIGRRPLLLGAAGLSAASAMTRTALASPLPVPPGGRLAFALIRHDDKIGTHTITFDQQGDALTIHIDVEVLVKFGPIPLVRYTHHNVEVWRDNRLDQLEATTDKNGTKLYVSAHRTDAGLSVVGSAAKTYIAPEDALPTTYWNKRLLRSPMIGTQDGMLVRPAVHDLGTDPVPLASGGRIPATRYSLRGDLDLDLWYDQTATWAGMEFSVADGSVIHYERL